MSSGVLEFFPSLTPRDDADDSSSLNSTSVSTTWETRLFIRPCGRGFTSLKKCSSTIHRIMELKYHGPWTSIKNVSQEVRDMWFAEFGRKFCWLKEDRHRIRRNFESVGSNILKNRLHETKKSNKQSGQNWEISWGGLEKKSEKEECQKLCEQNEKNHHNRSFSKHMDGYVSHMEHNDTRTQTQREENLQKEVEELRSQQEEMRAEMQQRLSTQRSEIEARMMSQQDEIRAEMQAQLDSTQRDMAYLRQMFAQMQNTQSPSALPPLPILSWHMPPAGTSSHSVQPNVEFNLNDENIQDDEDV